MDLPERLVIDEGGQCLDAEAVLALGEPFADYLNLVDLVGATQDMDPAKALLVRAPKGSLEVAMLTGVVVTPLGEELRGLRTAFMSQLAVERFLGYMRSQHERMLGQSKRNVPNRPELIEKYGWDVKYGSHALRLADQGFEIASTGRLSLPLPDRERDRVLEVKRGEVDRDEVSAEITRLDEAVQAILDEGRSPLPHTADLDRINTWAIDAQRRHWHWK